MKKLFFIKIITTTILLIFVSIATIKILRTRHIHRMTKQTKIITEYVGYIIKKYNNISKELFKSKLFKKNFLKIIFHQQNSMTYAYFEDLKTSLGLSIIYLMNQNGDVIFSTKLKNGSSLEGHNYSFRKYFKKAVKGENGIEIALGVTTKKRGLYYSFPIFHKNRIFVLVFKKKLNDLDYIFKFYKAEYKGIFGLIVDNIIFSASDQELILKKFNISAISNKIAYREKLQKKIFTYNKKINSPFYTFHYESLGIPLWGIFAIQPFNTKFATLILSIYLVLFILLLTYFYYSEQQNRYIKKVLELTTAIEQTDASIVITDTDGNIEYVNKAFIEETGYTLEEVLGKNPRILKTDYHPDSYYKELWDTITSGKYWRGEFYNKRKDGTFYWENAIITPVKDKKGNILKYIAIKYNTTELKKIEEKLRKEKERADEANRYKSIFLSNVTHELRTPLNAIIGFAEMLYTTEDDPDKKEKLNIVIESGKHLLQLINDLLDLSKIESGKFIELKNLHFNLNLLLKSLVKLLLPLSEKKNISIKYECADNVPDVLIGDELRIRQILINLINNAVKFTPPNGEIIVNCNYNASKELLYIKVTDTGLGIPEEKLKSVFEPFMQADNKGTANEIGTGLGLTISKGLIKLMNGTIEVKSKVGKGTTFYITIPIKTENKQQIPNNSDYVNNKNRFPTKDIDSLPNLKILAVDDIKFNLMLLEAFFKDTKNIELDTVLSGKTALELLQKKNYDFLLLDMKMPEMDGFEVLKIIRRNTQYYNLKVILLTADSSKTDIDKAFSLGADGYIVKPVKKEDLINKLFELLNKN